MAQRVVARVRIEASVADQNDRDAPVAERLSQEPQRDSGRAAGGGRSNALWPGWEGPASRPGFAPGKGNAPKKQGELLAMPKPSR